METNSEISNLNFSIFLKQYFVAKLTFKPRARFAALSMIAFMPEVQTLLTVINGVNFGTLKKFSKIFLCIKR